MDILLDTQIIIWFIKGENKIPDRILKIIESKENDLFVSFVSLWEIVIKTDVGKLDLKKSIQDIIRYLYENDISLLNVSMLDFQAQLKLPLHHKEPFDRIIIAQAVSNKLPIISSDRFFPLYPVTVIW